MSAGMNTLFVTLATLTVCCNCVFAEDNSAPGGYPLPPKYDRSGYPVPMAAFPMPKTALKSFERRPVRLQNVLYNIEWNIADRLGATSGDRIDKAQVEQGLRKLTGNAEFACTLVLKPNGKLSDLFVSKSTGSADDDAKALALIRLPKNYLPNPLAKESMFYQIEFPKLRVWNVQPSGAVIGKER